MADDKIFNKVLCKKSEIFNKIITLMTNNGWANISGNIANDDNVLKSTGINNTNNIIVRLRDRLGTGFSSVNTSDNTWAGIQLIKEYTPNVGGSGTFNRATETWISFPIVGIGTMLLDTPDCEITYSIDKNRCIFIIRPPKMLKQSVQPVVLYFGIPEDSIGFGMGDRDNIFATNAMCTPNGAYGQANMGYGIANNTIYTIDTPVMFAPLTTIQTNTTYVNLPPKVPDWRKRVNFTPIYFGSTAQGYTGRLTDLYALPTNSYLSFLDGDVIVLDSKKYEVVYSTYSVGTSWGTGITGNSFGSQTLVYRIA